MDNEPRGAGVGLDDVFGFRAGVFEAGRNMIDDGFVQDLVKFGSFDFEMASGVDFGDELEKFGDILASLGASNQNRSVRQEIKIAF